MNKAQFTLDMIDEKRGEIVLFTGYTHGDTWNGWGTPCFAKDEADRLCAALNAAWGDNQPFMWFDGEADSFFSVYEGDDDEPEQWQAVTVEVDGHGLTLYPIGAYCWTWNLHTDE